MILKEIKMMSIGDHRHTIRSPTIYRKLSAAHRAQSSCFQRVWACDIRNRDGEVIKVYVVLKAEDFYEYIISDRNKKMCWYEVIAPHSPSAFYLDIELETESSVDDNYLESRISFLMKDAPKAYIKRIIVDYRKYMNTSWTDDRCSHVLGFLKVVVKAFELGEGISKGGVWMSSCRQGKLSFHYVNKNFILERNYLSMRVACWLISRILWDEINKHVKDILVSFGRSDGVLRPGVYETIISLLMLEHQQDKKGWIMNNDTIIDERVYNRNQPFRLIGNHKLGKSSFMTAELSRCVSNATSKDDVISNACKNYFKYIGYSKFESTLVSLVFVPEGRTYFIPESHPFIVKIQKCYLEEFPDISNRGLAREFGRRNSFSKAREGLCVRFPVMSNKRKLVQYQCASASISPDLHTTECYDEDKIVTRADHVDLKISECPVGENIIHDCTRSSAKRHSMFGTAAAFIVRGHGDNNFLYCHSCQQSYAILRVHDPKCNI